MKTYIVHRNTIRKILSDNNFVVGSSYANGRIRGMSSFSGDIQLTDWNDGNDNISTEISSRKGNLEKAIKLIKKHGFKIKIRKLNFCTETIITK